MLFSLAEIIIKIVKIFSLLSPKLIHCVRACVCTCVRARVCVIQEKEIIEFVVNVFQAASFVLCWSIEYLGNYSQLTP
jgi:hypothetical protein